MSDLTDAEKRSIKNAWPRAACDCPECRRDVYAAVERIVAERQAQALEDAAEVLDPGPDRAHLMPNRLAHADWLRARAGELRGA